MKQRSGKPWMAADAYGRSLRGAGVNILVRDVARARFSKTFWGSRLSTAMPTSRCCATTLAEDAR